MRIACVRLSVCLCPLRANGGLFFSVQLLTKSSSLPLLNNSCAHFISIILSTRGLVDGQDSYPVFHVNPNSTLAHTIAKLAATKSHRMWVTDPSSPASTNPPTPSVSSPHISLATVPVQPPSQSVSPTSSIPSSQQNSRNNSGASHRTPPQAESPDNGTPASSLLSATPYFPAVPQGTNKDLPPPAAPPSLSVNTTSALSRSQTSSTATPLATPGVPMSLPTAAAAAAAAAVTKPSPALPMPGARLSGKLVGLVSLTDVLNLYARASGLSPLDPNISRSRRRRTSSSSSMGVRKSGELAHELWGRDR